MGGTGGVFVFGVEAGSVCSLHRGAEDDKIGWKC